MVSKSVMTKILARVLLGLYCSGAIAVGGQCLWLESSVENRDPLGCVKGGILWSLIAYEVFVVQERCGADLEDIKPCP